MLPWKQKGEQKRAVQSKLVGKAISKLHNLLALLMPVLQIKVNSFKDGDRIARWLPTAPVKGIALHFLRSLQGFA